MQPYPDVHRYALRPGMRRKLTLRLCCGRQRAARSRERREIAVTLRIHLRAAVRCERGPQYAPLSVEHVGITVAQSLHEPRRAFDVRAEKRHGAAWESSGCQGMHRLGLSWCMPPRRMRGWRCNRSIGNILDVGCQQKHRAFAIGQPQRFSEQAHGTGSWRPPRSPLQVTDPMRAEACAPG
jgi:hypothetical protein